MVGATYEELVGDLLWFPRRSMASIWVDMVSPFSPWSLIAPGVLLAIIGLAAVYFARL